MRASTSRRLILYRALYTVSAVANILIGMFTSDLGWREILSLPFLIASRMLLYFLPKPLSARLIVALSWLHRAAKGLKEKLSCFRKSRKHRSQSTIVLEAGDILPGEHYADVFRRLEERSQVKQPGVSVDEREQTLERLRLQTCKPGGKHSCKGCENQLCPVRHACFPQLPSLVLSLVDVIQDCRTHRETIIPNIDRHLRSCRAVCSACFYHRIRNSKSRTLPDNCSCYNPTQTYSSGFFCRSCIKEGATRRASRLWARTIEEVKRMERNPTLCYDCGYILPRSGVRWWLCSRCGRECNNYTAHSAWVLDPGS